VLITSSLAFWSAASFFVRILALAMFTYVFTIQVKQFQYKTRLQPLKRMLVGLLAALAISNAPIMYLHWKRIFALPDVLDPVTSFATFVNALSMFVIGVLLVLIYRFKGYRDDNFNG
jgi:hypothetical protein